MQGALDQKVQYLLTCLDGCGKTLFLSVTQIVNKATSRHRINICRHLSVRHMLGVGNLLGAYDFIKIPVLTHKYTREED